MSGIDFALLRGGRIEGTVTRASDAQPLVASVEIYDPTGTRVDQTTTDAAGAYRTSSGLATGSYYVRAAEGSGTSKTNYGTASPATRATRPPARRSP